MKREANKQTSKRTTTNTRRLVSKSRKNKHAISFQKIPASIHAFVRSNIEQSMVQRQFSNLSLTSQSKHNYVPWLNKPTATANNRILLATQSSKTKHRTTSFQTRNTSNKHFCATVQSISVTGKQQRFGIGRLRKRRFSTTTKLNVCSRCCSTAWHSRVQIYDDSIRFREQNKRRSDIDNRYR